jgi:hypothetical protein
MMISIAGLGSIASGARLQWMDCGAATWPSGSAAGTCSLHVLDPLLVSGVADFKFRRPVGGRMNESDRVGFAASWFSASTVLRLAARSCETVARLRS